MDDIVGEEATLVTAAWDDDMSLQADFQRICFPGELGRLVPRGKSH